MVHHHRTLWQWIRWFLALDFAILAVLFIFMPVYPWWAFAILAFVFHYIVPALTGERK